LKSQDHYEGLRVLPLNPMECGKGKAPAEMLLGLLGWRTV
jgi:hypothetical protein